MPAVRHGAGSRTKGTARSERYTNRSRSGIDAVTCSVTDSFEQNVRLTGLVQDLARAVADQARGLRDAGGGAGEADAAADELRRAMERYAIVAGAIADHAEVMRRIRLSLNARGEGE
jgi:hypothetical protein